MFATATNNLIKISSSRIVNWSDSSRFSRYFSFIKKHTLCCCPTLILIEWNRKWCYIRLRFLGFLLAKSENINQLRLKILTCHGSTKPIVRIDEVEKVEISTRHRKVFILKCETVIWLFEDVNWKSMRAIQSWIILLSLWRHVGCISKRWIIEELGTRKYECRILNETCLQLCFHHLSRLRFLK